MKNFCLSPTADKLFGVIDLAGNEHLGLEIWGFGEFKPRNEIW